MGATEPRHALSARRDELGLSVDQLARAVGVDRRTVYRWERGENRPYRRQYHRLAQALRWTVDRVGQVLSDDADPGGGVGAGLAGPVGVMAIDLMPEPEHPKELPADLAMVDSLRQSTAHLVTLDGQFGGDDLVDVATRAFRRANHRLTTGAFLPGVERDLQAAVGEAGEVAAWIAYDANRHDLSRWLNQEALLVSRLAGDRLMELFVLGNMAMQDIHLHRPAAALSIADHALAGRLSPRTTAMFRVRRGRALGQMGDSRGAAADLGRARALLGDGISPADPPWTWWIDDSELVWHEAMLHADLGQWRTAVDLFRDAYELRPRHGAGRVRQRVVYNDLAHLLVAQVAVGAWADAEVTMARAVGYVDEVASARTTVLLSRATQAIGRDPVAPPTLGDHAAGLARLLARPRAVG